jgi:hypothetical protein
VRRPGRATAVITLLCGVALTISLWLSVKEALAQFPPNQQASAFTGAWCVQGDPTKHASISNNGAFLTLTNESGNTSPGQFQGQTGIVAPGWQFVTGTLSPDGSQINWSNGTFWARCNTGGGGGHNRLNLTGTWYAQGNRSQSCSIRQRGNNLQLSNESGDNASGQITRETHLTTNWNGNSIGGTVAATATASTGITEPTGRAFASTDRRTIKYPDFRILEPRRWVQGWKDATGKSRSDSEPA